MTKRTVVIALATLVLASLVALAFLTRPSVGPGTAPNQAPEAGRDPLAVPLIAHMQDAEVLDVGPTKDHALALFADGDRVHVILSEAFLAELGPDALARLGLPDRDTLLSWDRYQHFLDTLHDLLIVLHPEAHAHSHGGEPENTSHADNH